MYPSVQVLVGPVVFWDRDVFFGSLLCSVRCVCCVYVWCVCVLCTYGVCGVWCMACGVRVVYGMCVVYVWCECGVCCMCGVCCV